MGYPYVDTPLETLLSNSNSVNFGSGYVKYEIEPAAAAAAIAQGADPLAVATAVESSAAAVQLAAANNEPVFVAPEPPSSVRTSGSIRPTPQVYSPGGVQISDPPPIDFGNPYDPNAQNIALSDELTRIQYTDSDVADLVKFLVGVNVNLRGTEPKYSVVDLRDLAKFLRG